MFALLLSFFCALGVILYSQRAQLFIDNAHKPQGFHTQKTPRAGGLGIFLVFLWGGWGNVYALLGTILVFMSGFLEDTNRPLSPKKRLFLQSGGVALLVLLSPLILRDFSPLLQLPTWLALPFSVFMLVGVINAINIIDGFNGLAGGLSVAILGILYLVEPNPHLLTLLLGVVGFLLLNFPKGYIFLGDGGAYLLGLVCGASLMDLALREVVSVWFGLALMVYPVTEVLFSIARRKLQKQKATMPDALHLHTLLFKYLSGHSAPLNPNALTGLMVVLLNLPFMLASFAWRHQPYGLLGLIAVFVCGYLWLYQWLLHYSKEQPCA
ncbi:glycosyltransferase family 4 protein [Helicobacter cynogastricus]|uniref:glycosyltransferase family 4 protein n=1 Tax=Helicobacter cynogastricus TaxID=329937 RepID=UPI000CF0F29B|nr:MraY family glycosyltransferase [Helicobacter cynogastricus]